MSVDGEGPVQCPRCEHSVRYQTCPNCRLRLYCRTCNVRLTDPVEQTACDVCGTPTDQAADASESSPESEAPPTASAPALVPASPTTAKVDELIGFFEGPGAIRRQVAQYAFSLMANGRLMDAPALLDAALAEPGEEPPDAHLLLLRAHCWQSTGRPGPAVQDLLATSEMDPELLTSVAPGLKRLLATAEAAPFRLQILTSWAPSLESLVSPADHLVVCEIELQAAVLQHDIDRALLVVERTRKAHGDDGADRCAEVLAQIRRRAPAEGLLFEALARTGAALGLADLAIADVDRAVQLGLCRPGAEVSLLEFKAALLSEVGREVAAAEVSRQAGERAYFEDDFTNAVRLLRRTWQTDADVETGWYLADALRMLSVDAQTDQRALLELALEVGNQAAALPPIEGNFLWGYSALGQIHMQLALEDRLVSNDHRLQGALGFERRLLIEDDTFALAGLAEAYRGLDWHALTVDAANRCRVPLGDRPDVLWNLGFAQLEVGDPTFTQTFTALLGQPQTTDLLRGVCLFLLRRYDESLAVLKDLVDSDEDKWSARTVTARMLWQMGRRSEAEPLFQVIRREGPSVPERTLGGTDRAFAAYALGEYDEAIDLLAPLADAGEHSDYDPFDVFGLLMLCHLARGDMHQAAAERARLLAVARNAYDGEEFLHELTGLATGRQLSPEVTAEIETSVEAIQAVISVVRRQGLALDPALAHLGRLAERGGTDELGLTERAVGALASSRLFVQGRRWAEAAVACVAILDSGREDPICAAAIVTRLFVAVDHLQLDGDYLVALEVLGSAADKVGPGRRREVVIRMVLAGLAGGQIERVRPWATEIDTADGALVASVLRAVAPDLETMYRIAGLAHEVQLPGLDRALLRIAEDALGLNLEVDAGAMTAPIVVDVGDDLVAVEPPADGPLFQTQLPALRERVEKLTGVKLPAILFRKASGLAPTAFQISVAEQWPVPGRTEPGMVYLRRPAAEVTAALGSSGRVVPSIDPVTGEPSCWAAELPPPPPPELPAKKRTPIRDYMSGLLNGSLAIPAERSAWQALLDDTGTWDDPLAFPLVALEAHVVTRLAQLIIADDVAAMAVRWGQGAGIDLDSQIIEAHLERLTALCRDLLDQGVALIPRPGSGAELEHIVDEAVPYPLALAAARDIFRTPLPRRGPQ